MFVMPDVRGMYWVDVEPLMRSFRVEWITGEVVGYRELGHANERDRQAGAAARTEDSHGYSDPAAIRRLTTPQRFPGAANALNS